MEIWTSYTRVIFCVLFTWTSERGRINETERKKEIWRAEEDPLPKSQRVVWDSSIGRGGSSSDLDPVNSCRNLISIFFLCWLVCGSNAQRSLTWWAELLLTWKQGGGAENLDEGQNAFGCPCKKQHVTTPQPRNGEKWTSFPSLFPTVGIKIIKIPSTKWDNLHLLSQWCLFYPWYSVQF